MVALLAEVGLIWDEKRTRGGSKWEAVGADDDATVVELAGKEHWWWDTRAENDGGCMDDQQVRPPSSARWQYRGESEMLWCISQSFFDA